MEDFIEDYISFLEKKIIYNSNYSSREELLKEYISDYLLRAFYS